MNGEMVAEGSKPTHTMHYTRPIKLTEEQREKIKFDPVKEQEAMDKLHNISAEEIERRYQMARVSAVVAALGTLLFVFKDRDWPRSARSMMVLPYSAAIGLYLSAGTGV